MNGVLPFRSSPQASNVLCVISDYRLDLYAQVDDLVYSYGPAWVNRVWRKLTRRYDAAWTGRLHRQWARLDAMSAHPAKGRPVSLVGR